MDRLAPANDPEPNVGSAGDDDDLRLIAAVQVGDVSAFESLYRRYQPRVARFIGNLIRSSPGAVEEAVNDTLMILWEQPYAFGSRSKLSTWLFAIAYRKAVKARGRFDRPSNDPILEAAAAEDGPDDALGRDRLRSALQRAMQELSPDHRAVVDLTYFHDMGYREIAEIMACPVDTVKTRMFHARRHLRRALAGELADWI